MLYQSLVHRSNGLKSEIDDESLITNWCTFLTHLSYFSMKTQFFLLAMQSIPSTTSPPVDVMVRLIEENLWCGQDWDPRICTSTDTHESYLREAVFPTLIPALYELLKKVQRSDVTNGIPPTGQVDPVAWFAHYMLRNNAAADGSRLAQHPYSIVSDSLHLQRNAKDSEE